MRYLGLILGLGVAGCVHAGTITVNTTTDHLGILFASQVYGTTNALTYSPSGNLSTDPNWTYTAALLTNLVDAGGGTSTASGSLQVQFTNVTLTCTALSGCDQTGSPLDFGFVTVLHFLNASAIDSYALSLSGSGPDLQMNGSPSGTSPLALPTINQIVSGPNYSFAQSGALAPASNMAYRVTFALTGNYASGTTVSLPGSFDIYVNTVPEPATFGALAMGIGVVAWRLRRRAAGPRR